MSIVDGNGSNRMSELKFSKSSGFFGCIVNLVECRNKKTVTRQIRKIKTIVNMTFKLVISIVLLFCVFYFFVLILNSKDISTINQKVVVDGSASQVPRVDCEQHVTYCFEDSDCARLCRNISGSVCRNGICLSTNVLNSTQPINECNAARGVVTFFVGNSALGRYESLCRSVDLGIAPNNPAKPNNMCKDGLININYLQAFPSINDCVCPPNTKRLILPATSIVRQYAQCVPEQIADRIVN